MKLPSALRSRIPPWVVFTTLVVPLALLAVFFIHELIVSRFEDAMHYHDANKIKWLLTVFPSLANHKEAFLQRTPLHEMTWNQEIMELLLKRKPDVSVRDEEGWTPLHFAADEDTNTVKLLLAKGADINARAGPGWTPLHCAAESMRSDPDVLEMLLAHGADINAKMYGGATPLMLAVRWGNQEKAKLLIHRGAEVDIFSAAGMGDVARLRSILGQHPELINAKTESEKLSLLHYAVLGGSVPATEFLLSADADVNVRNNQQETPLGWALSGRMMRLGRTSDKNEAPTENSLQQKRIELICLLHQHGAHE